MEHTQHQETEARHHRVESRHNLTVNDWSDLRAFKLTPVNTDDREPVPDMTKDLLGKLFGDCGYISQALFEQLYERGLQLVTKFKKNMKKRFAKACLQCLRRSSNPIELTLNLF
ncbi:MAG: transposase [Leptolyngbya sp. BL-A-14]